MLFKDRLAELRETAGLTQRELADRSGVTLAVVRQYEQGQSSERLNFSFVAKLAAALGKSCDAFADCEDVTGTPGEAISSPVKKPKIGRPKKKAE